MNLPGEAQCDSDSQGSRTLPYQHLLAVLGLIGFTAVIAQVVLMRELLVVFQGNEISLGLMLAAWLFWTAVGAHLLGRRAASVQRPAILMAGLQAAVAVALPLAMLAVRAARPALDALPGEVLGPVPMIIVSLATLGMFCTLSGFLFAAGSRLFADSRQTTTALATGAVYLWEAVGSTAGGLLASFLLIPRLAPFEIAALLAVLNLAGASLVVSKRGRLAILTVVILVSLPVAYPIGRRLEAAAQGLLWRGFQVLEARNTMYGNLVVTATDETRTLYENGLLLYTIPDRAVAEEAVHYALLQHPAPSSVLLIGGGVDGSLSQILDHPTVREVDYVELDPEILRLATTRLGGEWLQVASDLRVRLHLLDGRRFVKSCTALFDVIILHLPDPQTAQLNRFYTLEFFREAAERLRPGGILSFQVTGAENYISPELAEFLGCIHKTLQGAFAEVAVMPGATIHFLASPLAGSLTLDPALLISRIRERRLRTQYVREYFLPFRLAPDRMRDLQILVRPEAAAQVNRDFFPIAYYFNVALWSGQFHSSYRRWFVTLSGLQYPVLAGSVLLVLGAVAVVLGIQRRIPRQTDPAVRYRSPAGFCVAVGGFTSMSLEILFLFAFQALYGYVFQQLAILIAAFMAGMALGCRAGLQTGRARVAGGADELRLLTWLQGWTAVAPVLLYGVILAFSRVREGFSLTLAAHLGFPLLAILAGFVGGCQFAIASRAHFRGSSRVGNSPGTLYALDLLGACAGAILISTFLVPVYGFFRTALLVTTANLPPAALAAHVWLALRKQVG
jgi:spermidine synthase